MCVYTIYGKLQFSCMIYGIIQLTRSGCNCISSGLIQCVIYFTHVAYAGCIQSGLSRKEMTRIIPARHFRCIYLHTLYLGEISTAIYITSLSISLHRLPEPAELHDPADLWPSS